MPELPEVETVCRGLAACLGGRRIRAVEQRRRDLRFPFPRRFAARLEGRRIDGVERRAKYILIHFDDGTVLLSHLGMTGSFMVGPRPPVLGRHDHLVMTLDNGAVVRFNDVRRFGFMDLAKAATLDRHPLLRGLGPEPLGQDFDAAYLSAALKGRRTAIKAALMDQRLVAGLGNIYVSESLFWAGLSPRRRAGGLGRARAEALVIAIRKVLTEAIAAGGSSLRDYVQVSGELGYFQHLWAVYARAGEPCPGCDCDVAKTGGVRRIVQGGRATFYCPRRQT